MMTSLSYGQDGLSNGILSYDSLHINNRPLSRSGDAPSSTDATMVSASISKGDFFADGRLSTYRHGSEGGINYALASDGDHYNVDQWQVRAGAHYNAEDFSGTFQAAMVQDSFTSHQLLGPIGLELPKPITYLPAVPFDDGFYGIHEAFIRTYKVNNTLSGNIYGGAATFGISGSWSSVNSEKTITTDRDTGTGMTDYSTTRPFINPNGSVNNLTGYMTYELAISSSLVGYASLTVDRRNGLSPQIDPRIATVYVIDPANQIKFSISRAHRNPSWQEMFTQNNGARSGNPDLHPEIVMAYETQYIHQFETDHTLSVNLFRLNNDDQIYLQNYKYVNGSKSTIQGIEGEWRKRYDETSFYAAYTHIWAEDGNGVTLANTPSDTARGFITQTLNENWYGSLAGRWQSTTPRASTDPRNDMKAIGIIDTSIGYKLPYLNSEVQFTVKNIFDEKELYPSPSNTYDGDYPSTGRAIMATVRGTF